MDKFLRPRPQIEPPAAVVTARGDMSRRFAKSLYVSLQEISVRTYLEINCYVGQLNEEDLAKCNELQRQFAVSQSPDDRTRIVEALTQLLLKKFSS